MRAVVSAVFCVLFATGIWAIPLPFEINRDPFQPFAAISPTANSSGGGSPSLVAMPMLKLTGVVWDAQDPYAVIVYKGVRRIVTRGDRMDAWQILTISPKDVTLKGPSRIEILKIGQEIKL